MASLQGTGPTPTPAAPPIGMRLWSLKALSLSLSGAGAGGGTGLKVLPLEQFIGHFKQRSAAPHSTVPLQLSWQLS